MKNMQLFPGGRCVTIDVRDSLTYLHDTYGEDRVPHPASAEELRAIKIQELAEKYCSEDILHCDTSLVSDLLELEGSGSSTTLAEEFNYDNVENLVANPSDWDIEACREYLDDHGYDYDYLEPNHNHNRDRLLEMLGEDLESLDDYRSAAPGSVLVDEFADEDESKLRNWWSDQESSRSVGKMSVKLDEGVSRFEIVEALGGRIAVDPYPDKTIEELRMELIDKIDCEEIDGIEVWREEVQSRSEPTEVYEWWRVTSWLRGELSKIGEVTLSNSYGDWWGRGGTGQNLIIDGTLQQVAARFFEARQEA